MDIDLLWAIGGWFLFFDCMATITTTTRTSPIPKTRNIIAVLALLLFVFLVSTRHVDQHPAVLLMASSSVSITSRRLLSENSVNFHPKPSTANKRHRSSSSTPRREFEAGAHEVPSGPNPISNR
ncbi:CLAVATA3/ESR (CLE)-related protein TDIF-like [Punica granatum]|uniref:Uncharacterized protein n=2 Tax=Punica granatum TaxID=22663 RepID=A0A2I0KAL2_PUNGR|nr:CLAVATA3/ESR (CLE)-related protein TDIF-like [Punica granatum]PKI64796.1 hypothetical protein CRG98_014792 [Punica granatum]